MVTRIRIALVGLLAVFGLFVASAAQAEVRIDITRGNMKPLPIAIPDLFGTQPAELQTGKDIARVVAADLERSGLFKPIDQRAFIQNAAALQAGPRFADWRQINAEALVSGKLEISGDGDLMIEFRLWDVFSETQMIGTRYNIAGKDIRRNPNLWRRAAHQIADAIYKRVTGEDGYFDTQLIYISESGPKNDRKKRLAIMDQDGENHRFLTSGEDLVLTPRFSPTAREITYMSYFRGSPRVYILQIDTARRELLGDFPGMTFAPRFSPDGNKVIMSLSQDGNAEIYEMNLLTRQKVRLTNHPAIDTSPSYAPDSARVVFNSDRGGSPQLYTMGSDGGSVARISFGDGRYTTPVWSPRGDLIAFTKQKGSEFFIGVMRPDGSDERLLAQGYLVEGPTWAPNGRVLAFWKETASDSRGHGGTAKLYTIDLTGFNERQVITPLDGSDPAWSPLIP
ncbi:Tol-Pal system beta propeller repeat protein TolB [Magnetospirillum sulfuroxidans]|uniref:Tol-Pal system protein TolB n=1 Tax=Magnetospirillum sulfuroxidans TaxID=611300 RepID=A0ABS5I9M4_9PROT|nr:Tol-Pal system beta propeller repeat protein TolB [Magnetospirillum sulfuroxidans]MBR9970398.1 Tol-Pal system protein TolB [Magnetospirillum sulfuroxidans]